MHFIQYLDAAWDLKPFNLFHEPHIAFQRSWCNPNSRTSVNFTPIFLVSKYAQVNKAAFDSSLETWNKIIVKQNHDGRRVPYIRTKKYHVYTYVSYTSSLQVRHSSRAGARAGPRV